MHCRHPRHVDARLQPHVHATFQCSRTMKHLTIERASLSQLDVLMGWACAEGWNPGLDDARLFHNADPSGFLMLCQGEVPIAGISVVSHDARYGFLGLYICHPDYRGQGFGWKLWQAGLRHMEGRIVGLDGVPEQQDNYRRSGFDMVWRNIRYQGSAAEWIAMSPPSDSELNCRLVEMQDKPSLQQLDHHVHGHERLKLLDSWLEDSKTRKSILIESDGRILGFGTIRQCQEGFKAGPLIATDRTVAEHLMTELCRLAEADSIILDIPEPNTSAISMVEAMGMQAVFTTARMYSGPAPSVKLQLLFGVTSFELG